jgi:hypothetical protein
MWSLSSALQSLGKGGHLPAGFESSRGIRPLFPAGRPGGVSISLLKNYVFSQTGEGSFEEYTYSLFVGADGAGNWVFQGALSGGQSCSWAAGFVFLFPGHGTGHGCVTDENQYDPDWAPVTFTIGGSDPWISANWPDVFASSVYFDMFGASGFARGLPDTTHTATNVGFSGLTQLQVATPLAIRYQTPSPELIPGFHTPFS